jgi:hypothetical protein
MDSNHDRGKDTKTDFSREQLEISDAIQSLQDTISEIERIVFEKDPAFQSKGE